MRHIDEMLRELKINQLKLAIVDQKITRAKSRMIFSEEQLDSQLLAIEKNAGDLADALERAQAKKKLQYARWAKAKEELDIPDDADVVVINSDSRFLSPKEAYDCVLTSAITCKAKGITQFYKKIDSTLRGNIKEEIDALLDALDFSAAIIAPSAPDIKRTVKRGCCFIGDVMIHNSESGKDLLNPVSSSYIPDHFLSNGINRSAVICVEELRKPFSELKKLIENLISNGIKYIICDAESKNDLAAISELKNMEDASRGGFGSTGLS